MQYIELCHNYSIELYRTTLKICFYYLTYQQNKVFIIANSYIITILNI